MYYYKSTNKNFENPHIIFTFDTEDLEMDKSEKFDNPRTMFTFGINRQNKKQL